MTTAQVCVRAACTALLSGLCTLPQYASPVPATVRSDFADLPIYFEQNHGQADPSARYVGRNGKITALIRADGLTLASFGNTVSMRFIGARSDAQAAAEDPIAGVTNYYRESRALTGLTHYGRVRVNNVRPGIDVVYYGSGREIEYDLMIHPGADPSSLRIRFDGAEKPLLDANGDLVLKTTWGEMRHRKPHAWQPSAGRRQEIECRYSITRSGDVRLVLGPYEPSAELVVDPILAVSTYIGGNGDDSLRAIAVDSAGYIYLAGSTRSTNFPVTDGSVFQGDSYEVFVTKINPQGSALVYSTYISPVYDEDGARAIAVDSSGNAFVTGSTGVNTFPKTNGQFGGARDAFVLKLGPAGKIVYSTILGGGYSEHGAAIAVDAVGAAYVVGRTASSDFPITGSPLPAARQASQPVGELNPDSFIAKLLPSGQVSYASNFGGGSSDEATAVAVDASGNAYVAGYTFSNDFPTTAGSYAPTQKAGGRDAFVAVVNPSGSAFVYSTYLGGSGDDAASGIALDAGGSAYVTGTTGSLDFPAVAAFMPANPNGAKPLRLAGFVAKLNPAGTSLVFSSYLGGSYTDTPAAIAVDSNGAAYVTGTSQSGDFPTTAGALKRKTEGPWASDPDLFLVQVAPDGKTVTYSTLFGSGAKENAQAMVLDASKGVYIAGTTNSSTLVTTSGAFQPSNPKTSDSIFTGFVAKIDMSSTVLCNAVVNPPSTTVPWNGGAFSFSLTLPAGCPWEAVADLAGPGYVMLSPPVRGMGSQTAIPITGTVDPNQDTVSSRTFSVKVGNAAFTITQSAAVCNDVVVTPLSVSFDSSGGSKNISVTQADRCGRWSAVSERGWLTITGNPFGWGSGTVTIYAPPSSFNQRAATLTVAGKAVTVTQSGTANCTATVSSPNTSFTGQGGTGVARITTNQASCLWTGYSAVPWIQVAAATGQSAATVPFIVAGNPGAAPRSGQVILADQFITINQSAGPAGIVGSYTPGIVAGGAPSGSPPGDGGPALSAYLSYPRGLAFDPITRNLYFAELYSGRVRVVTPDGKIDTVAGGGASTDDNIPAKSASLHLPDAVAVDSSGSVYVTEPSRVRKISQGMITTVAGGLTTGYSGDNGPAANALLNNPLGLTVDASGNLYIADSSNDRVRKVSGGTITNFAGGGSGGLGDNGPAVNAALSFPRGLATGASNNIYFVDHGNRRVRKVSAGVITTVAGGGKGTDGGPAISASLYLPSSIGLDPAGNLFIADQQGAIRKVDRNGTISSLVANNGTQNPYGLTTDPSGNVYYSDTPPDLSRPHSIRVLTPVTTFCTYNVAAPPLQSTAGGTLTIAVNTAAGCNWSAFSDLPWATTSASGSGSGTASVLISPSGGAARSGAIYVAGRAILITQGSLAVVRTRDIRGMGMSDAVIYDPANGQEYTALSNGSGGFDYVPNLFTSAFDTLRFGDFNADGKADLVLYNSATALGYIGMGDAAGHFAFQSLFWSPGYDRVTAGDLNGDGKTDFVLYRSSDGTMYSGLSNGSGIFTYKYTLVSAGYNVTVADFNGDGKADVFLYRTSDGLANLGLSDGSGGFTFVPLIVSPGYDFVQAGEIDGNGAADLLLYNGSNGNAAVGLSIGSGFSFTPLLWSPGLTSVRLLDFDGDGKADVTLYNRNNFIGYLGAGNGTGAFTFRSLFWGSGMDNIDVLDLNGDGKMDVILYNSQNAATYTGISTGNPASPFTYQYSYWGTNRLFAK